MRPVTYWRRCPTPLGTGPVGSRVHGTLGLFFAPAVRWWRRRVAWAGADFAGIKALLAQGQTECWWHYEVGCGTDQWWNA
ncbi:hypothetical protein [Streptomyces sirii]|uniref:hypothetical protein n=1 Tax=Streptomyces sirii TaxID=3127701 RepID=UPI003D36A175